jgi:hypothetical protein
VEKHAVKMQPGWNDYEWYGRNMAGQRASCGLYLLRVKAGKTDKIMKIAVK